jgi:hypothetical protein
VRKEVSSDPEIQFLREAANEAAQQAVRQTWDAGFPVYYGEAGWLMAEYPDGRTERIKPYKALRRVKLKRKTRRRLEDFRLEEGCFIRIYARQGRKRNRKPTRRKRNKLRIYSNWKEMRSC